MTKRTRISPPLEEEAEVETLPTQAEMDAYAEIGRIREQLGDEEAKVVLKRRNEKGLLNVVGVLSATDFDIERVLSDFGGGRYEATFYQGKVKVGPPVTFDIDPSIPSRVPVPKPKDEVEELVRPAPASFMGDPRLAALEQVLSRQADLLNQLVVNLATQGNGHAGMKTEDAIGLALKMVEVINSRTPTAERPSYGEIADMIKAGIDLGRQADGNDDSYWPVLKTFAEPVAKVLDQALARERGIIGSNLGGRPAVSVGPAVPQVPAPATPPAPALAGPSWLVHLQPHLGTLLAWARAGKDPDLYGEVILDQLPPGAVLEIQAAAQDPQFVEKTLAVLPMFQPYSAWATQVLTVIKTLVTAPEEQETAPEEQEEEAAYLKRMGRYGAS